MRQEFLMLADGAEAVNGKIYILGGGVERHYVQQDGPAQLKADIALGILIEWSETNNRHALRVVIVDEDERVHWSLDGEFEVGRPPGAKIGQELRNVIAVRGPFPLPGSGAYKVALELAGTRQEPPFRFWVERVEAARQARPRRGGSQT